MLALSQYLAVNAIRESDKVSAEIRVNDGQWRAIPGDVIYSDKGRSFVSIDAGELKAGDNRIDIRKSSKNDLFVSLGLTYFSREEETETTSGPLRLSRDYFRLNRSGEGNGLTYDAIENENLTFESGEEFLVKLTVRASEPYEYMVLEDFIPAGFQVIENSRGYNFEDSIVVEKLERPPSSHKEVRDNRMVFFFDSLKKDDSIDVYYLMRAALNGTYRVNPAVIRSMYYDERRALSKRLEVEVRAREQ